MKIILVLLLISCLIIWIYKTKNPKPNYNNIFNIWYDGAAAKLCITKNTKEPAVVKILTTDNQEIISQKMTKHERIIKIPLTQDIPNGKFKVMAISKSYTTTTNLAVKNCNVKIVNKNHE